MPESTGRGGTWPHGALRDRIWMYSPHLCCCLYSQAGVVTLQGETWAAQACPGVQRAAAEPSSEGWYGELDETVQGRPSHSPCTQGGTGPALPSQWGLLHGVFRDSAHWLLAGQGLGRVWGSLCSPATFFLTLKRFQKTFLKILFIFREGEGDRKRNINVWLSLPHPSWVPRPQPRPVP